MRAAEAEAEAGGDGAEPSSDEFEPLKDDDPQSTEENELELA